MKNLKALPLFLLILTLFSLPFHVFSESKKLPTTPPFGIMTIHKSGTHLIMKCLELLQSRNSRLIRFDLDLRDFNQTQFDNPKQYVQKLNDILDDTHYFNDHSQLAVIVQRFSKQHPAFPWILGVRDLRDALVSQIYFFWDRIEEYFGPTTAEQKLDFLLDIAQFFRTYNHEHSLNLCSC